MDNFRPHLRADNAEKWQKVFRHDSDVWASDRAQKNFLSVQNLISRFNRFPLTLRTDEEAIAIYNRRDKVTEIEPFDIWPHEGQQEKGKNELHSYLHQFQRVYD